MSTIFPNENYFLPPPEPEPPPPPPASEPRRPGSRGWEKAWRYEAEAVESSDLTLLDLGLLTYLKLKSDRTKHYRAALTDLKAVLRFPGKRTEYLRQRLHALRDAGLLAFEVTPGGRTWVFSFPTYGDEDRRDLPGTSKRTSNSAASENLEVTSNLVEPGGGAIPRPDAGLVPPLPPSAPPPKDVRPKDVRPTYQRAGVRGREARPVAFRSSAPSVNAVGRRKPRPSRPIIDDCIGCGERPEEGVVEYEAGVFCAECAERRGLLQPLPVGEGSA